MATPGAPRTHTITPAASEGCAGCRTPDAQAIDIAFAFQPIVDVRTGHAYAHEALVRGPNGESAYSVLSQVDDHNRYHFDQRCRTTAIAQASGLGMTSFLSINFMPNAVYQPQACIQSTFRAAQESNFPIDRIIFETVEGEHVADHPHLVSIFKAYREFGFQTAIDDFGAGYSGLTLLADFQPDFIKIDMGLIRNVDTDTARQHIVHNLVGMCRDLGVRVIAEGIESRGERDFLANEGIELMQGYFFAKPLFKGMSEPVAQTWKVA